MRLNFLIFIIIIIKFVYADDDPIKYYNGYSVFQVIPKTHDQLQFLKKMANNVIKVDFWKKPSQINQSVDIMVAPEEKKSIVNLLKTAHLKPDVLINDVESHIEKQKYFSSELSARQDIIESFEKITQNILNGVVGGIGVILGFDEAEQSKLKETKNRGIVNDYFTDYKQVDNIYDITDRISEYDPRYISVESIGKSFENRDLKVIKIGNSKDKPIIWIDGGTHAREWLSITTALYIAHELAYQRKKCFGQNTTSATPCSAEIKELLTTFDWIILPVLNPDGYQYTKTRDRLWRKTRSRGSGWLSGFCRGTDPNRNYDIAFGGEGTSNFRCSDTYHGGRAFSEPETRNTANYIMKFTNPNTNVSRIKMFITLHTYSQLMLLPYSYSASVPLPAEYPDLEYVALEGAKSLIEVDYTDYRIGSSSRILYAAAGSASDWSFEVPKVKYSYTFELRDKGKFGFVMPAKYIVPTGNETLVAIKKMAKIVSQELVKYNGHTAPGSVWKDLISEAQKTIPTTTPSITTPSTTTPSTTTDTTSPPTI